MEQEGSALFSEILSVKTKTSLDEEDGGFKQPSKLSNFIKKRQRDSNTESEDILDVNSLKRKRDDSDNVDDSDAVTASSSTPTDSIQRETKKKKRHGTNILTDNGDTTDSLSAIENTSERNSLAGQICRQWLKYQYLKVGTCCDLSKCQRKHVITGKPESLYSDYSFKGLKAKQQKIILEAIRKERSQQP